MEVKINNNLSKYLGRVTDDKDRRLITTLLEDYYCDKALEDETYTFALDKTYVCPYFETHEEYLHFIKNK